MQTNNEIVVEARAGGAHRITIDRENKHDALPLHLLSGIALAVDDAATRAALR